MESRWIYGVHVESIWNLWGSVKYSKSLICQCYIWSQIACWECFITLYQFACTLLIKLQRDSTLLPCIPPHWQSQVWSLPMHSWNLEIFLFNISQTSFRPTPTAWTSQAWLCLWCWSQLAGHHGTALAAASAAPWWWLQRFHTHFSHTSIYRP